MRRALIVIGLSLMMSVAYAEQFEVGQVWHYKTRADEQGSTLMVVKVDELRTRRIIHISLTGLQIKNPREKGGYSDTVSHLPVSEDSLLASVTTLIEVTDELPEYEEGYNIWRKAFEQGKAGVFKMPVSECIEYMEQAINQ